MEWYVRASLMRRILFADYLKDCFLSGVINEVEYEQISDVSSYFEIINSVIELTDKQKQDLEEKGDLLFNMVHDSMLQETKAFLDSQFSEHYIIDLVHKGKILMTLLPANLKFKCNKLITNLICDEKIEDKLNVYVSLNKFIATLQAYCKRFPNDAIENALLNFKLAVTKMEFFFPKKMVKVRF